MLEVGEEDREVEVVVVVAAVAQTTRVEREWAQDGRACDRMNWVSVRPQRWRPPGVGKTCRRWTAKSLSLHDVINKCLKV